MTPNLNLDIPMEWIIPPGWKGGFAESNTKFAYPYSDLSSIPLTDNLKCIDNITRQQEVEWPKFSWEAEQGNPQSRCF
jgi:hypothetical protein